MTYLNVMEDVVFIEGLVASLMFPITKYLLKITKGSNLFWYLFGAWLLTWYLRKFSYSLFKELKKKYKWNTWYIKAYVPFL